MMRMIDIWLGQFDHPHMRAVRGFKILKIFIKKDVCFTDAQEDVFHALE